MDRRLAKAGLGARARVFAEDAKDALPRLGPDGVFKRAYLLFPDPWWKKRHAKRLVMGDVFMEQVARLLMPGGELFVETDVEERAHMYTAQISLSPHFSPAGDAEGAPEMAEKSVQTREARASTARSRTAYRCTGFATAESKFWRNLILAESNPDRIQYWPNLIEAQSDHWGTHWAPP